MVSSSAKFAAEEEAPTLREWLKRAPYSLALSPGFFQHLSHVGVLSALDDEGLLHPGVKWITGASGGCVVASLVATGLSMKEIREKSVHVKREEFWDPIGFMGFLKVSALRLLATLMTGTGGKHQLVFKTPLRRYPSDRGNV